MSVAPPVAWFALAGRADDNRPMSVFAGWSPEAARLPDRLDDLHGPWQGVVVLPVHLTWYGLREFDVAVEKPRLLLYSIVLSQGRPNDLARFVNARRLRDDWPKLRMLLRRPTRRACERKLGLRPTGHRARAAGDGAT
jgi:hypothetical protein